MTATEIFNIITQIGIIVGGTITAVKTVNGFFSYLNKRVAEKSVGATAVMNLMEADRLVRKDMEEIKDEQKDQREIVNRLASHYDTVVAQAIKILTNQID